MTEKTISKRRKQLDEVVAEHGSNFIFDLVTSSYDDVIKKYSVSYRFCKFVEKELSLSKDAASINRKRAERYRQSLANGGLEKRRKTMLEKYGTTSVKHTNKKRATKKPIDSFLVDALRRDSVVLLTDVYYNEKQQHYIRLLDVLLYGAERMIKSDTPIFNIGKTPAEFILNGGRKEFAEECKKHTDPLWFPTSIDILEHYGYTKTVVPRNYFPQ